MNNTISHNRNDETIEAKVHWFRSLPISERLEMLCSFTDLALSLNSEIADKQDAEQIDRRFQILSKA